jgi:predicted negative regulator of RcsB-dependent stress response
MASPSNANDPDSPEQEEEFIDTGFDAYLFWDRYRLVIIFAIIALILGISGYFILQTQREQAAQAAGAALAQASSEEDLHGVMDKYPGTVSAGDAALMLAGRLRGEGKFDEAMQTLQDFESKFPTHPLFAGAELAIGETLEAQGKTDEALTKYQGVAAKYSDTYVAPLAVLDQANLLQSQGKPEEARRVYENFVEQFPDSLFEQQAMAEMRLLRTGTGATAESSPATLNPATGISLPNLMSTPAPAAPAASPEASAPAIPAPSAATTGTAK